MMTSRRLRTLGASPNSAGLIPKSPGSSMQLYLAGAVAVLGISAFVNIKRAKTAENDNPPMGRFIEVEGVRLHVFEMGQGEPLVLLHGNGSMIEDFVSSGLVKMASSRFRVIVFDRPGYGHSSRPRNRTWTDAAQADLIQKALTHMGVFRATVLGHSWGCSVAVALALNHPEMVSSLILASGYYFPSLRADVATASGPAIPIIGDVIRYTLSPLIARVIWPLLKRKIFGPAPVPAKFDGFPKEMAFRPSQIRASAAETALMVPDAFARYQHYDELSMPIVIIAGEDDRLVDIDEQSARLHAELPRSTFHRISNTGHMVHHTATKIVMAAIDEASQIA